MSELDFDELDKAVNTLMNDAPKVDLPGEDDAKTFSIAQSKSDSNRSPLDELNAALSRVNGPADKTTPAAPQTASAPAPVTQPAVASTVPPLAARRGGRFMDVVHPSSDMTGAPKPSDAPSRQGVAIGRTDSTPAATESIAAEPKDVAQPIQTATNDTTWPDPLDMSGYSVEPDTESTTQSAVAAASQEPVIIAEPVDMPGEQAAKTEQTQVATAPEVTTESSTEQPLTSPFLTDTKVVKRPLGGAPAEETADTIGRSPVLGVLAGDTLTSADPNDQLPPEAPQAAEPQLPPELQSDLLAVETDTSTHAVADPSTPQAEEAPVEQVAGPAPTAKPQPVGTVTAAPVALQQPVTSGPPSIPQQYKEEPTTSDQSNGSIYDTSTYHQPLMHPVKKRSGWLWIIWILLMMIVGGGGAAALYFFDII